MALVETHDYHDDADICRAKLMEELSATNSYKSWFRNTINPAVRLTIEDIFKEEEKHTGQLLDLLTDLDSQAAQQMELGSKERQSE